MKIALFWLLTTKLCSSPDGRDPLLDMQPSESEDFFAVYLNCCAKWCEQEHHKDALTHAGCVYSEGLAGNKAVRSLVFASTAEGRRGPQ